jgi:hypothetical protein
MAAGVGSLSCERRSGRRRRSAIRRRRCRRSAKPAVCGAGQVKAQATLNEMPAPSTVAVFGQLSQATPSALACSVRSPVDPAVGILASALDVDDWRRHPDSIRVERTARVERERYSATPRDRADRRGRLQGRKRGETLRPQQRRPVAAKKGTAILPSKRWTAQGLRADHGRLRRHDQCHGAWPSRAEAERRGVLDCAAVSGGGL